MSAALTVALFVAFVSGVALAFNAPAALLLHRYSSYAVLVLATGHVVLYRRILASQVRRAMFGMPAHRSTAGPGHGAGRRPTAAAS